MDQAVLPRLPRFAVNHRMGKQKQSKARSSATNAIPVCPRSHCKVDSKWALLNDITSLTDHRVEVYANATIVSRYPDPANN